MTDADDILIVGAGPTGLSCALFLAEHGVKPRIVERRPEPSPHSKAFGVNARSLELLTPSGVAGAFIENGRKMDQINIRRRGELLASLQLDEVKHQYPFMIVQSQADSERILAEAVEARGIKIERGVEVVSVHEKNGKAEVGLKTADGVLTTIANKVFAADGPGSFVRRSLDIGFDGDEYDEPWRLYDIELETSLDPDDAHIFLLDDGGMFVVRHTGNVWRVLGSGADLLGALPQGTKAGEVIWESEFRITNAVADQFVQGPFFLAGDAAHVHAGIGARGMNLGIEDSYVFAELYAQNRLDEYHDLRHPVISQVVGQIKHMMNGPRANTGLGRAIRTFPFIVRVAVPLVRSRIQPWVLGLDHKLGL
jgi:2-polyprenyl-6-methoxyphenol hydroxylase-like FAD-dependent oxidoreductase